MKVSLRDEPQPDGAILELIERVEDHGIAYELDWETGGPFTDMDDTSLVEDRRGCDLGGMTILEYGEWLRQTLPGYLHGYSDSLSPERDIPTPLRLPPGGIDGEMTDEFVGCLQRRLRLGMALHRDEDKHRRTRR